MTGRDVFFGRPKISRDLPFGIWERTKGRGKHGAAGIKPLLVQINAPRYARKFDFHGIAKREAGRLFKANWDKAWRQVIG